MYMKSYVKVGWSVAAAALIAAAGGDAQAGTCVSQLRPIPASGTEAITLACEHASVGGTSGTFSVKKQASTKTFSADLQAGGTSTSVQIEGLDNLGNPVAGCAAFDSLLDGRAASFSCTSAAAVQYRVSVTFSE
jgi:hypothetical protein